MSYQSKGRNVMNNSGFNVAQRGTSIAVGALGALWTLDRWSMYNGSAGACTITQEANSPNASSTYSVKIKCTTADVAYSSSQYNPFYYSVEGYDYVNMLAGRPLVLSFWAKTYQTGIFSVSLNGSTWADSCVFEFTMNASATWEKKIIQVPVPTGTFGVTSGVGIRLVFCLGQGTDFTTSTLGSWQVANKLASTNSTNLYSSTDNYMQLAQIQLEAGTAATEYDAIPYADELARCQRYLVVYGGINAYERIACGFCYSTKYANFVLALPVEMRAAPTPSVSAAADFATYTGAAAIIACNEFLASYANQRQCSFILGQAGTSNIAGDGAIAISNATTAARLYLSAEI